MPTTTNITTKNFTTKLSAWSKSAGSMRQTAQEILEFGFEQYLEHGDAGYLSRLVAAAFETKGINANQMKKFVLAHANLSWSGDTKSFSKTKGKKGEPNPAVVTTHGVWWEFEKPASQAAKKPLDVNARLTRLVDAIDGAEEIKISVREARALVNKLLAVIETAERAELDQELIDELNQLKEAA